jgi:hypothetical protein
MGRHAAAHLIFSGTDVWRGIISQQRQPAFIPEDSPSACDFQSAASSSLSDLYEYALRALQ